MRKTVAACLTAAFVLGSVGGAVAQERGYQGYGTQNGASKKAHRDSKGQNRHRGSADGHWNKGNSHTYNKGKGHRYGQAPRRVYRGQVHRNRQGWQTVPPAYSHRYRARPGYRYYRVGNDVVLVAIATGLVLNVLQNAIR